MIGIVNRIVFPFFGIVNWKHFSLFGKQKQSVLFCSMDSQMQKQKRDSRFLPFCFNWKLETFSIFRNWKLETFPIFWKTTISVFFGTDSQMQKQQRDSSVLPFFGTDNF